MVDLVKGLTPQIIAECQKQGLLRNQTAYVLATGAWETNHTLEPVKEGYYLGEPKATRFRAKLRYAPWWGRGIVQLTWEHNYYVMGKEIGVDLIANPDAALEPENAVKILVTGMRKGMFTGHKLSDYITVVKSAFHDARRIINKLNKATDISELALEYDSKLRALHWA